jgi:hypothetical protein
MKADRIITMAELLDRHPELRPTPAEKQSARGRSTVSRALKQGACVPPRARSLGERAAHVLLWAAKSHPGKFVAHADLAAVLLGVSRDVTARRLVKDIVAASIPGARRVLLREGHFVLGVRGVGFRCTVDKADAKANYLPRMNQDVLSRLRTFLQTVESIEVAKLSEDVVRSVEQSVQEIDATLHSLEQSGVDAAAERARLDAVSAVLERRRSRRARN